MLYLLEPPTRVLSTDVDAGPFMDSGAETRQDVDGLEWDDSTAFEATQDVVRAALAHGVACSRGVVVGPDVMADVLAPELQEGLLERHRDQRRADPDEGGPAAAQVEADAVMRVEVARQRAAQVVGAPVDPELEAHWLSLGGVIAW